MNKLTNLVAVCALALSAAACSKTADSAPNAKACDAAAINALAESLDKANGLNVDLQDKKVQADIEAAKKEITGKQIALRGCTFASQGNDEIDFGATGTDKDLDCQMKGGEADVKAFRQKAMKLDREKIRLDVRGEIALGGMEGFERLQLTKCTINVHE